MTWLEGNAGAAEPAGDRLRELIEKPEILGVPGTHNGLAGMLAKEAGFEYFARFRAYVKDARRAGAKEPFMRVRSKKVHILDRRSYRTQRLNAINTKKDITLL